MYTRVHVKSYDMITHVLYNIYVYYKNISLKIKEGYIFTSRIYIFNKNNKS